jgi:hypothetical protein
MEAEERGVDEDSGEDDERDAVALTQRIFEFTQVLLDRFASVWNSESHESGGGMAAIEKI